MLAATKVPIITTVRTTILATSFAFIVSFIVVLLWHLGNSCPVRPLQVLSLVASGIPNANEETTKIPENEKAESKGIRFSSSIVATPLLPGFRLKTQTETRVPNISVRLRILGGRVTGRPSILIS
jgi:hypothetical protein